MSKAKIYKISKGGINYNNMDKKSDLTSFIVGIIVYAVVLMIASSIFRGIYVENFLYAIIAALILSFLNYTIKPILILFTLPLSIGTFGILYPIVNIIILYLCDILMGRSFEIGGFVSSFIIAIFISGLKMFLDEMITKKVK